LVVSLTGVLVHGRTSGGCWPRRNSADKTQAYQDNGVNQTENSSKPKKKKFSIFSLARKSLSPKKAVKSAENVPVTAR